jgi:(p)ppGpp synthase/HD superfamily hydrolase
VCNNKDVTETLIERARRLAAEIHEGQVDKQGRPYIEHVEAVAAKVAERREDGFIIAAALLHDAIEDGPPGTDRRIRDAFHCNGIATCVRKLTRDPDEDYLDEYIERVAESAICTRIKLADLAHNLDESRGDYKLPPEKRAQYEAAVERLTKGA